MSKQPQPRSRSNPQPRSRPMVPDLPGKTGNKSGGLRGRHGREAHPLLPSIVTINSMKFS